MALFFAGWTAFGVATIFYLAGLPGDGGPLWGYSLARVALMAAAALPSLAWLVLGGFILRGNSRITQRVLELSRKNWMLGAAAALTLLGWLAFFLPGYWWGEYAAYYERFRPLLVWLGLIGLQTLIVLALRRGLQLRQLGTALKKDGFIWRIAAIVLVVSLLVWGTARLTGLGIESDRYWNEAGVPVLGVQVLISIAVAMVAARLLGRVQRGWAEALLMLLLWGLAVLLWAREPLTRTYFTPGPYYPDLTFYPFSDAAYYDAGGQYILLGKLIDNNYWVDKPLYMLFLGLLRAIGGQSYEKTILLQVMVLALQPVLIYLLGRDLHSRPAGVMAALLVIFQERNAIAAGTEIQVSHVKLMLTESMTALLMIWLGLLLLRWWGQKSPGWKGALLAGAVLGVVLLVRPNPLLLAPIILLAMLAIFKKRIGRWALISAVFIAGMLIPMLPWTVASEQHTGQFYLLNKINLVLETRYRNQPEEEELNPQATPTVLKPDALLRMLEEVGPETFIPAHFIHNHLMSAFILPHSFVLKDLPHTLQTPYWKSIMTWDGKTSLEAGLLVWLNLLVTAVGMGNACKRWKWAGLAPLLLEMGYHLANALGRTSGGRYLVPVDWVWLLYAAGGTFQVFAWLKTLWTGSDPVQASPAREHRWQTGTALGGVALLGVLGMMIPLSGSFFPERYQALPYADTGAAMMAHADAAGLALPWTKADLTEFIQSGGVITQGRALYPRYYGYGEGEPATTANLIFRSRVYPRMIFTLLSPANKWTVVLPGEAENIVNGGDVYVLGCPQPEAIELNAAAVVSLGTDEMEFFQRSPGRALMCPLAEPVCNNNRVCR